MLVTSGELLQRKLMLLLALLRLTLQPCHGFRRLPRFLEQLNVLLGQLLVEMLVFAQFVLDGLDLDRKELLSRNVVPYFLLELLEPLFVRVLPLTLLLFRRLLFGFQIVNAVIVSDG